MYAYVYISSIVVSTNYLIESVCHKVYLSFFFSSHACLIYPIDLIRFQTVRCRQSLVYDLTYKTHVINIVRQYQMYTYASSFKITVFVSITEITKNN
jgi:hypothetical protein